MQYARAIADGHPFVYTPGNGPTTGSTSLWYPLLLLPPHLLRLSAEACVAWVLAVGAAFYAASAFLLARLGTRLGGTVGGVLAFLLFAASPHLLWGYFSGMEIALYGTALLLSVRAYLDERRAALFPTLPWWLFVLAGSRPEGAVLCGVYALLMAGDRWKASRAAGGPSFVSPALLLPIAAAALPFLVNLAITGSLESTSSQAKSILAEPYAETRAVYLQNTPTIVLNIGTMLLSLLTLEGQSSPVASLTIASGIGVLLFVLLALLPGRAGWSGGIFLVALVGCGVVVNAIPVHWFVHLFRYQQGLFTLAILLIASGWGRVAWWAWARLPRAAGAAVAAIAAIAPAAVWFPALLAANDGMVQFYARNCENILNQQTRVGRWIDANLPGNAVVGLNDAGAIAYYGRRSTVDLIGLTSAGFARVYRSGSGCLFEHMRRLPADRLPTHVAIYPEWFSYWPESGILGPELFRAHLDFNTICAGTDMVVYPATWSHLRPDERPVATPAEQEGLRLVDSVDLAWLEDERRHAWRAEPEAKDVLRRYTFAALPARAGTDGGRIVRGTERFRAAVEPGKDLTIVMRTDAWYPTRLSVRVDGADAGIWSFALSETAWVEPRFTIRGALITRPRAEIALVRQTAEDEGSGGTSGRDYSAFRIWLYQ
jgi:hypothetical protein